MVSEGSSTINARTQATQSDVCILLLYIQLEFKRQGDIDVWALLLCYPTLSSKLDVSLRYFLPDKVLQAIQQSVRIENLLRDTLQ